MKKLLTILSTAFAGVMLFSSVALADTATPVFKDVDATTNEGKAIIKMYNAGILAGYEDNTFKPDGSITRAELVRVFNQVFKYSVDENTAVPDFVDNTNKAAWYYNDVKIAQANGYINGFEDNTFRPQENFTRQQVCVVMDLITKLDLPEMKVEISDAVSDWATGYVNRALVAGFFTLEEGNTFRATENITRGEVCELLAIFVPEVSEDNNTEDTTVKSNEAETEVITAKTHNGTVVSVTTGGGGGGSSSSNKTTTATEATTEATTVTEVSTSSNSNKVTESTTKTTTEVTTEATTEATTVTTEATTETTTIVVDAKPSAEIVDALNRVYKNMSKYVIPNCSTDSQKTVAKGITNSIYSYLMDYSYDFTGNAQAVMQDYKALPANEKNELKNLIIQYNDVASLLILQEHYFPGLM